MDNWMAKYEKEKDEILERKLNIELEKLLDLLDEAYRDEDRIKVLSEIIKVYDRLGMNVYDYDENDCKAKKKELVEIRYKIKKKEYMEELESQSWNEYKEEEQEEER